VSTLYAIATFYKRLNVFVEEQGGEITLEQWEELLQYEDDIDTKVDALRALIIRARAKEEYYKQEIAVLDGERKVYTRAIKNYRRIMKEGMKAAGVEEAGKRVRMKLYKNANPSFDWEAGKPLPDELKKVTVDLDKSKAREAWVAGFGDRYKEMGLIVKEGDHVRERHRKSKPEEMNFDE
jgi:hypothetical protein